MDRQPISSDSTFFLFALPTLISSQLFTPIQLFFLIAVSLLSVTLLTWALSSAGPAWPYNRSRLGPTPIPGVRGLPLLGSLLTLTCSLPHRTLARLSRASRAHQLLAFSVGSTPTVVSTDVAISKEILTHPNFSDRPIKFSARELMFHRAMGFAPNGAYWRLLRRIASSHLFAPRRIAAHEPSRQLDAELMLHRITSEMSHLGRVTIRPHLQTAALNNVMGSVFGIRYEDVAEADTLKEMVREGFELLGAFNWCDHLPWLSGFFDPGNVKKRCSVLVPRVKQFVQGIIDEHRSRRADARNIEDGNADFVDVLLNLEGEDKLDDDDIIAVLWEMIFRGTDTTALLTEWALAELILNQDVQIKLYNEIAAAVRPGIEVTDADVAKMPYLQAVIKETLRVHPPGPLLSWARLSTDDVKLSNGMVVPAGTTAMVNMWGITHDEKVWARPEVFDPERFIVADVDVRGCDLRLAPFGAGRRVCPGKNLGLVTVGLWVAKLVRRFKWEETEGGVDLSELLKLSCEMKCPLVARTCVRN